MRKVAVALVLVLAACESVTSESIQKWKGTEKGPGKLQEALKSSSVSAKLRAEASVALVDIGMADQADILMAQIPAGERWEIVKSLIPIHAAGLRDAQVAKARAARDGLFSARGYAAPEEQKQIDVLLMPSLEADVRGGRPSGGRHSMEKMLAAFGPAAGPMLLRLLQDPKVPFASVTDLLVRVADEPTRAQAATALVQRAAAMPEVPPAMWRALGAIGGKPVVDFCLQKIEKGFEKDALAAAQALQQRREPSVLPVALKVAGDPKARESVRDEMFGVVEKIGGPEAQRGLVNIIATDPRDVVRYRAYEAALEVGKAQAVLPALEAFPASLSYKKEDVVDFLVKDITKLGPPAKPVVLQALGSSSPLARMAAVLSLEAPLPSNPRQRLGAAADAAPLLRLSGDKGTVKGFPAGETVGKEASRVSGVLKKGG